mgnify:CR=1 FL=1
MLTKNYSFNTSHVVVYPDCGKAFKTKHRSFNTSHVVVYQ